MGKNEMIPTSNYTNSYIQSPCRLLIWVELKIDNELELSTTNAVTSINICTKELREQNENRGRKVGRRRKIPEIRWMAGKINFRAELSKGDLMSDGSDLDLRVRPRVRVFYYLK